MEEKTGRIDPRAKQTELPPSGNRVHDPTTGTTLDAAAETTSTRVTPPVVITHLRFGTPDPPKISHRARSGIVAANVNTVEQQNSFTPVGEQESTSGGRNSEVMSSEILREGSTSAASSSSGRRSRDLVPLTPEIMFLLDRLEPNRGKQARLLTEHLTGQRILPCTEQELHM